MIAGDEWDLEMVGGGGNDAIGHIWDNVSGDFAQTLGYFSGEGCDRKWAINASQLLPQILE
jgi:hypothetical protein